MGRELQTFLDYPPLKRGASFNLDTLKVEMAEKWHRRRRRAKALASNRNYLHGGRLARVAHLFIGIRSLQEESASSFRPPADRQAQHRDNLRRSKVL